MPIETWSGDARWLSSFRAVFLPTTSYSYTFIPATCYLLPPTTPPSYLPTSQPPRRVMVIFRDVFLADVVQGTGTDAVQGTGADDAAEGGRGQGGKGAVHGGLAHARVVAAEAEARQQYARLSSSGGRMPCYGK